MKLVVLFLLAHRTADVACTVINRIHKDLLVTSNGSWLGLLDGFSCIVVLCVCLGVHSALSLPNVKMTGVTVLVMDNKDFNNP